MSTRSKPSRADARIRRLSLGKKILFTFVPAVILLVAIEGGLALLGVRPPLSEKDPFVGFVSNISLFAEAERSGGRRQMVTAQNKRGFFNVQSFDLPKPAGTYRVFCLGGSTTYGRPYSDRTSFSGWLRELLPVVDPRRRWEVVNAGGISYASYRIASLVEELAGYEPDLFVIYTGHNEFLEERTYRQLRRIPSGVRSAASVLARTRIWNAMETVIGSVRGGAARATDGQFLLPAEVKAALDHSAGPALYERDDELQSGVVDHYAFSLQRIVEAARSTGADVLLVNPASNLKDCTPFKSQHTDRLDEAARARSRELLASALSQIEAAAWEDALATLDSALTFDPRHAELHYRRGQVLLATGRTEEAGVALTRARDEDVCPLRAITPIQRAAAEMARDAGTMFVDAADIFARRTREEVDHPLAGEETFLDHVHPTIEGHRLIAEAVIDRMIERGIVTRDEGWGPAAVAGVVERVEQGIDHAAHALALANLALTLDWAGKKEDSRRLAFQALESGVEDPTILMIAGRHLAMEGKNDEALDCFQRAVKVRPGDPVLHSQLGMLRAGRNELEAAAAHLFLASLLWQDNPEYHRQLGAILSMRGRPEAALSSLLEARRLAPADRGLDERIASIQSRLGDGVSVAPAGFAVTRYESGYPKTIAQTQPNAAGRAVPDGIWTEWYDGGGLKGFADYVDGVRHGVAITWDERGRDSSRREYRNGAAAGVESE